MNCGECRWWRKLDDIQQPTEGPQKGRCHRFPPKVTQVDAETIRMNQPVTRYADFCGEFEPIPTANCGRKRK